MSRITTGTAALLVLAALSAAWLTVGPSLGGSSDDRGSVAAPRISATDSLVQRLQNTLLSRPDDPDVTTSLGFAYLQKARETGDPTFYSRADALFQQAAAERPNDTEALLGLGSIALARHDFQLALQHGRAAEAAAGPDPDTYGLIGDAQVELGQYEEGVASFQQMINLRPDLNSYARVSYARELYGDLEGAIEAMGTAVASARPAGEASAWAQTQLGHLHFQTGDLDAAKQQYESSLAAFPGYVHSSAGLARVAAAEGDYAGAIETYERITAQMPLMEYVIALGEVYQAAGDEENAARQFALVDAIRELNLANGVNTDLEAALYLADHGDPAEAVRQAETAYATQPSIQGADILAWALFRDGRVDDASVYSAEALRTGTKDLLITFHAGMINRALGNDALAVQQLRDVTERNPGFSAGHAAEAAAALEEIQAQSGS